MISRRSLLLAAAGTLAAGTAALQAQPADLKAPRASKKGLAGAAPVSTGLRTTWYYDWSTKPASKGMPQEDPSIRFMPMLWGLKHDTSAVLNALAETRPDVLLGFNEPDHRDQSNLSVEQALAAWPHLVGIAKDLVGPSCAQPDGHWMQKFIKGAEMQKLHVDSVGFHHYGSPSADAFMHRLERVHRMYGRPIWVTEFGVTDWNARKGVLNRYKERDAIRFIETVCPFMERTPWVRGYAWFPWGKPGGGGPMSVSAFFLPDGRLSDVGQAYASM